MKQIAEVTIPQFIRRVKLSNSRLATYYYEGEQIPKKYEKAVAEKKCHWIFLKERKGVVLVDADGDPIIKNPRVAGTPRYKNITGQDLHRLTLKDYDRAKIIHAIKNQMKPRMEHLDPIHLFPIRVLCEVHTTIHDPDSKGKITDIDNMVLFHLKAFPDILCGDPLARKGEDIQYGFRRIIPDDSRKYITQPPTPLFFPIDNYEERKLVFKIFHDDREIIKNHPYYAEFQQ
jgi:hypothetical protein